MNQKNIYLFFGEDHYSSQQKLNHWRQEFIKKYGDLNYQLFEGENFTTDQFSEAINTVPFLSEKKLIIVRDFLRDGAENDRKEIAEKLENVSEYCVLIFIEHEKPDARTALFKKLNKIGQAVEFSLPEKHELIQWIQKEMNKKNSSMQEHEATLLAEIVGPNLWQLSHELEKIALYAKEKPIDAEAIENLASKNISSSIFQLTDYVAQKNAKLSIKTLQALIHSGEDLFQIFFMIIRHFRILLLVQACIKKNLDRQQIIQKTREHPYAIMTAMKQCKNFTEQKLTEIYQQLLSIDIGSKSGKIKTTTGDNGELRLALEKLMVELCV